MLARLLLDGAPRSLTLRTVAASLTLFLAGWNGHETSDELVARADHALYAAKQAGRNRLCLAGAPR